MCGTPAMGISPRYVLPGTLSVRFCTNRVVTPVCPIIALVGGTRDRPWAREPARRQSAAHVGEPGLRFARTRSPPLPCRIFGHRRQHRMGCHECGPVRAHGRAVPVAPSRRRRYSRRDIMPKRRNHPPAPPPPVQLPLFAETASLVRIRPELNEWRYYRMAVWPDLFGRALLVRQWGRIGTEGRRRFDPHPDPGAAINALAALLRIKRRRGYQDRSE